MNTRDLIARLRDLGVKLAVVDGELRISAPKGVMTPELRNDLAGAKEQLIELLSAGAADKSFAAAPIPHANRSKTLPLSFAQQRMWFMEEFKEGTSIYNIAWAMRIRGELDVTALEASINDLVARHETLRTTFTANEGEPAQLIAAHLHLPLEKLTFTGASETDIQKRLSDWSKEPFNLRTGPLLKARLLSLGPNDHVLMLVIHHIISDAWSLDVLQREFVAFYKARSTGGNAGLTALPLQFADYAVWQQDTINEAERARQLAYWKRQLAGAAPVLELPVDRPRPAQQTFNGARRRRLLPLHLQQSLVKLARQYDGTLFMVLLAAFEVLLHRYTGQDDIVVGTPIAGRQRSELETLIGLFLNTLVMRGNLAGNPSFATLLQQVQKTSFDAYAHQDLPFERLVDVLAPERNTGYSPVFQVLFMLQNAPASGQPLEGLQITPIEFDYGTAKFDLTLATGETPDGLVAEIEYNTDLFDAVTIERLLTHYATLLEAIAANPQQRIGELPLLDAAEEVQLERWNATDFAYDQTLTMHALFEQQAAIQPDATALWADGESLSYAELNRRANRLAQHLVTLGARPGTLVGVCVERRAHMITGLLATLKSGAAYVPLDPDYPAERVRFMLDDSQAPIVLTQTNLVDQLPDGERHRVCLDSFDWGSPEQLLPNVTSTVQAADLGYVIYTSGSTGKPKGVSIEHRNAVALIRWTADAFDRREFDGVLASTSICFDLSVFEIFCTLGLGGRIVLVRNALALPELPADVGVTLVNTVPSAIAELVRMRGVPASVQTVNLAGEPLTTELADAIYALGTVNNVNDLYGPSEDTTYSTWIRRTPGAAPRIGKPIHNTQAYVLDQYGQRLPVGIPGELYLGGSGVTRDYLNRPELSAEKFLPDRFRKTLTGRLYRTGDRVRYHRDGNLEFLGRIDHQIKLRGFRIELGEIESNLRARPEIDKTVVIVREDTPGDQRLVAYVTPAGTAPIDTDALRQALRKNLPDHMIPAAFVVLDAIPLTPNGKTDRKALPAPEWTATETYVAPRSPLEAQLCDIWAATLGVEQVGIHDDFFALGGHSLLAMKLVSRIRDGLQIELPLPVLFNHPTVAGLATHAGADAGTATAAIVRCDRSRPLPLSFAQQRMWFLYLMEPDAATYNVPWAIRLHGHIDRFLLQQAVDDLVQRHESLRTVFANSDDEPVQIVVPQLAVAIEYTWMHHATDDAVTAELHALGHRPFDLQKGPPLRVALIDRGDDDYVLLLCMHHIICDAWSHELLYRELVTLYEGYKHHTPAVLPALPVQYADYAVWQRTQLQGAELDRQFGYWKTQLSGAPPLLNLPLDQPRPAVETHAGATVSRQLDPALSAALNRQARACGGTLFSLLLTAFTVLLHRYSGEHDIVVGTPVSGRRRSELEGIIGFFLNTLAIRTDLDGNPAFDALAKQVARTTLDAFTHQDLPFEKLVEELQPVRNLSHAPIFQVLFVLNRLYENISALTGVTIAPADAGLATAKFDLELHLTETPGGLFTSVTYNLALFNRETVERLLTHYAALLEAIAANPQQRIGELPLLDAAEELQLERWNATDFAYDQTLTMHALFEQQAATQPDAIALWADGESLSYAELNRRANRLAQHLVTLGARPGTLVGVCVERRAHMITGLLATLKSGAAYVPLDPDYPAERVRFMLDDSQAPIVLTQTNLVDQLPDGERHRVCLDSFDWGSPEQLLPNVTSTVQAADLGYVIYTSGSTGKPKGVSIEHRNAVALIRWTADAFDRREFDGVLASTSICFDLSVFEIFCTLGLGGRIVLVRNALALPELPADVGVTLVNTVPSAIAELVRMRGVPASVQTVNLAGEPLTTELADAIYALGTVNNVNDLYGPSEDTTYSTWIRRTPGAAPRIGKPIHNTQAYVLDQYGQRLPVGIPGELYLGGSGVTRDYLNRPELSAEKFLPDRFRKTLTGRLYRTGDRVRYHRDGNLEFLGRIDHQIKLRGFRIELGEIESNLRARPEIDKTVVIVREDTPGDQRLVAYVTPAGTAPIDTDALRQALRKNLPDHMIPAAFVVLDAIPLTPNGKTDRKALPAPEWTATETYVAPRTPLEAQLCDIWAATLGVEQVGIHDDFFALGGHSLLAMKLVSRIRDGLQIELALPVLFNHPTVAGLATHAGADAGTATAAIVRCDRSRPLPLSFAQQRMWFLYLMEPDAATYNVPWAIRLHGHIDRFLLQQAVDDLVQRHESLRTVFANSDDEPVQIVVPQLAVAIEYTWMHHATDDAVTAALHALGHRPFDLQKGPPLRVALIDRGDDDYVLLLCMHHIICDAWSHELLYRELVTLYEGYKHHTPAVLPALPVQYADYAVWQRTQLQGAELDRQFGYWKTQLSGAPPLLNLPLDQPRPAVETHAGATVSRQLDPALSAALNRQARACGGTLFSLLLTAFTVLLHRYSGEHDIVVGTPVSGRRRSELEGIIGFFLNTLAIRTDLDGNPAFDALAKQVARTTLDAFTHQDLPFEKLVEELQPVRNLSHAPIFQVLFVLNRLYENISALTGVTIAPADAGLATAKFDLELHLTETPGGLFTSVTYNLALFNRETVERLLTHYAALLEAIAANPQQRIGELPLLETREYDHIVYDLNDTAVTYPGLSIVDLVEAQVAATPAATAIQAGTVSFSYAELNARANRLSRQLLQAGARHGVLVAICAERSIDTPVAILAVLKTGAAYVPVDPGYPPERVSYMLEDSQAPIVLTQAALADKLPAHNATVIAIDTFDWDSNDADNPGIEIAANSPGYVIYTSGSTGKPKGVLLPHCALTNLLQWQASCTNLADPARTLQFASFSFDVSFQEIFSTWQQGGTLVMIDEALRRDLPALGRFITAERIERLYLPYAAFQPLVDCILNDKLADRLAIRDVVVAGEQLQITPTTRQLFAKIPGARLHNQYGPSETHVVTACTLDGNTDNWPLLPPIGKPVSNTQTYVLDGNLQPVPIGVPGELYIGGIQVALGYLNRADLTAEKFRPDVFSKRQGARLYRTGDRVRILANGDLEYLGRTDDQVKWRGFRIEPGEIESTLASHPQVQQAAVMLREDTPGDRRLVAYVVTEPGTTIDTALLRAFAKQQLPEHMLPSAIVILNAMPLTPSGKVARRLLPMPETADAEVHHGALPASHGERAMAEIWKRLLKVKEVHLQDNFFDLGGHSLLTIKLIQELEKATGQRLTIANVFENPTLGEFSALLSDAAWPAAANQGFSLIRLRDKLKSWLARA